LNNFYKPFVIIASFYFSFSDSRKKNPPRKLFITIPVPIPTNLNRINSFHLLLLRAEDNYRTLLIRRKPLLPLLQRKVKRIFFHPLIKRRKKIKPGILMNWPSPWKRLRNQRRITWKKHRN
jgi:hypothetical protein